MGYRQENSANWFISTLISNSTLILKTAAHLHHYYSTQYSKHFSETSTKHSYYGPTTIKDTRVWDLFWGGRGGGAKNLQIINYKHLYLLSTWMEFLVEKIAQNLLFPSLFLEVNKLFLAQKIISSHVVLTVMCIWSSIR